MDLYGEPRGMVFQVETDRSGPQAPAVVALELENLPIGHVLASRDLFLSDAAWSASRFRKAIVRPAASQRKR